MRGARRGRRVPCRASQPGRTAQLAATGAGRGEEVMGGVGRGAGGDDCRASSATGGPPAAETDPARPTSALPRARRALDRRAARPRSAWCSRSSIASHYGAMGIPRSDDWSYLLTLFRWVDTGELTFNGWVSMTLVGQIADRRTGRGDRRAEHHVDPALHHDDRASSACSASCSSAARSCGPRGGRCSSRRRSRSGPMWGPLAPTFMTDVPTFTFEMLSLAAAAIAFRRRPLVAAAGSR